LPSTLRQRFSGLVGRATRELPANFLPTKGSLLDDKYRIGSTLGQGGMGIVLHAFDEQLARDVAIKLVRPEFSSSPLAREQFVHEARAMARVRNPNVVEIYAFGEFLGTPYFVMEYMSRGNLGTWLDRRGDTLPAVDEAVGFLDQVCRGLQAIHDAGIVHHDLKPSNILIDNGFRVAVSDLGLVRLADPNTTGHTGSMTGTPAYVAPETALGEPVGADLESRTDIYALGVMAFELLTGSLPFDASAPEELIRCHVEEDPPAASDFRPDLPIVFDPILERALAKSPAERTPSADTFRRDLLQARARLRRG
jgi:serine/threonine-protein kinase